MTAERIRCFWATEASELEKAYHDLEWGRPLTDEHLLFEALSLGGAQAGLSWRTILKRRDGYRAAFANFDPEVVAGFGESKLEELLQDPGIIRNRAKVRSVLNNARAVLALREEGGLAAFMWSFTGGVPMRPARRSHAAIPAVSPEAEAMSKALKKKGFTFVGPTILYATMQSVGMVNDHTTDCFCYAEVEAELAAMDSVKPVSL